MAGWEQRDRHSANSSLLAEGQKNFPAFPRQPCLHQAGRPFRNNNLAMRRDVIAVRVRHERESLRIPWVQPKFLFRQINPAFVTHLNHDEKYA